MNTTGPQGKDIKDENKIEVIEEKFDLTGLLLDYLSNWKYFVLSIIICIGGAFCYIRTIVPTFKVGAAVYLNDDGITKTSAVTISSGNPLVDTKNMFDMTELEILKSRNSLLKIVDSLQLSYSYYTAGKWRDNPIYRTNPVSVKMDSISLNNLEQSVVIDVAPPRNKKMRVAVSYGQDFKEILEVHRLPDTLKTPAGRVIMTANGDMFQEFNQPLRITIRRPDKVAAQLASSLSVNYGANSATIVNFGYVTPIPNLGTDILKTIIVFYNRQIIEDKNRAAIQTENFIQARLKDIQNELKDVEENLRDYRQRHNIINLDAQVSMNLNKTNSTETSLNEIKAQENVVADLLGEVRRVEISASKNELAHIPAIALSATTNGLIDRYNHDVDTYNQLRIDMTEESDIINQKVSSLREQKNQIIRSLESSSRQLAEKRNDISLIENRSNRELESQPTVDKGLQEIFRDQSVKANIYTFLLQKREEIALQKTLATPTAQFIDNPSVQEQIAPRRTYIYIISLILGLVIPALLIFLKRILFPKFKGKEDIERITRVPVIGEICKTNTTESEIVVGENVSTGVAELFRLLRNNIQFAKTGGEKRVILLTSSISGEGKTFIALNLAMTYALTNKRVVVVGLDIRRPVLAHKVGLSNRLGVTSYLSDQIDDISEIIYPTDLNPNLFVIPAGPVPPNPNELLMGERMAKFFETLRKEFDYVIVDTAPIGLVSDSLLLMHHSDVQLFVTRASYSTRHALHTLHEAINNGLISKPYILLNSVNMRSHTYNYRRYGAYNKRSSRYGYGYGYGKRVKPSGEKSGSKRNSKSNTDSSAENASKKE